jgi:membrane protease YdiL (CAAX protease family)
VLSDRAWLAVTVVVLGTYDVLRRLVIPDGAHFVTNTAMIGVVAALAVGARATRRELGLEHERVRSGLRLGGLVLAVVVVTVLFATAVSDDPLGLGAGRTDLGTSALLFQVLVEIPIATVVFEELAFRGLVVALLERICAPRAAMAWSALLFGLWHLGPAWPGADIAGIGRAMGIVGATAIAGVVLHLLKRRSGSLVAPVIAHWATNGAALAIVWLMAR